MRGRRLLLVGVALSTLAIGAIPRTASGMSCAPSVTLGGIDYIAEYPNGTELPDALLGEPIGPTPSQPSAPCSFVAGCTSPDNGSLLRRVAGYEPYFRLTGMIRRRWVLFEVERNAAAKQGSDIYDLRGRVQSIRVVHGYQGQGPQGSIEGLDPVARFVGLLLSAPVGAPPGFVTTTDFYGITFEMLDGTETRLEYSVTTHRARFNLEPGAAFEGMLAAAVR